jgi:hypothetical protein
VIFIKKTIIPTFFIKNIGKSRFLVIKEGLDSQPHFLGRVSDVEYLGRLDASAINKKQTSLKIN